MFSAPTFLSKREKETKRRKTVHHCGPGNAECARGEVCAGTDTLDGWSGETRHGNINSETPANWTSDFNTVLVNVHLGMAA